MSTSAFGSTSTFLKKNGEKAITVTLCLLPIILVSLFAGLLINNSHTDSCHPSNYVCESAIVVDNSPNKPTSQPTSQPSSQPQPDYASNLAKAKAEAAASMARAGEGFAPAGMPGASEGFAPLVRSKYNCKDAKLVGGPTQASKSETNKYFAASITFIILLSIIFVLSFFWNVDDGAHRHSYWYYCLKKDKLSDDDLPKFWGVMIGGPSILILIILTIVFLAKKPHGIKEKHAAKKTHDIKEKHAAFSISLIGMLIALGCFLPFVVAETTSKVTSIIIGTIVLIIAVGTAILHTTEADNLTQGFLDKAINNTTMKILPFLMAIVALGNLGAIGYGIKGKKYDKPSIVFMITQAVSAILLIACIGFYYNYKSKCNSHSSAICKPIDKSTYDEDGNLETGIDCKPVTNMPISKSTVTKTCIALSVLMALTQIVGIGAAIKS